MTDINRLVGAQGERLAAQYLIGLGMAVVDRNWRCEAGEVDLIARDGDDIVFVEVKTRRSHRFGEPIEAIVPKKAARIRRLAMLWLTRSHMRPRHIRFDVVGVLRRRDGFRIEHVPGAF